MGFLFFTFTFIRGFIIFVCDLFLHTVQHYLRLATALYYKKRVAGVDEAAVSDLQHMTSYVYA
jgi:hypothetical protein